jgi:hypothetical protein
VYKYLCIVKKEQKTWGLSTYVSTKKRMENSNKIKKNYISLKVKKKYFEVFLRHYGRALLYPCVHAHYTNHKKFFKFCSQCLGSISKNWKFRDSILSLLSWFKHLIRSTESRKLNVLNRGSTIRGTTMLKRLSSLLNCFKEHQVDFHRVNSKESRCWMIAFDYLK